jgi:hypothetical protein
MAKPPTPKQLRYLKALAARSGTTFSPPKTVAEAARAIDALKQRARSPGYERYGDARSVADQQGAHDGSDVRDDEIHGWGANAHWAGRD